MAEAEWDAVRAALQAAGVDPTGFGRFVNRSVPGVIEPGTFDEVAATPTLLEWLPRVTDPRLKSAIAAHVSHRGAKGVSARVLLDEFRAAPDAELDLKWQLADRISRVATPEDYDEITEIAADPRHGTARQMLVAMLWRVKTKRARAVLLRSVTDDGVCLHAMSALRRLLGNDAARGIVEPLAEHPSERVRRAARAQLRKIANAGR